MKIQHRRRRLLWAAALLVCALCMYFSGLGMKFIIRLYRWQRGRHSVSIVEQRIHAGMTEKLVIEMVGTPDDSMAWSNGVTRLSYDSPEFPFTSPRERISGYVIYCTNGVVVSISPSTTSMR